MAEAREYSVIERDYYIMNKIAFMFCGGGAQYPGMMKELYDSIPECRGIFDEADRIIGRKLSEACFYGSEEELSQTENMIPAIYISDLAAYMALKNAGIEPDYMLGFSLGEWAALTASGVISVEEGISIVQFRSEAMERSTPVNGGGMGVILKQTNEAVETLCNKVLNGKVYPANYNYEGQVTVSGDNQGLEELEKIAGEEHVIYKRLPVNAPSHCELMESAKEELRNRLGSVDFNVPTYPIVSNATAKVENSPEALKENAIVQLVKPVLFEQSAKALFDAGVDCFVELGPGKTLSKFIEKTAKKNNVICEVHNVENLETLKGTIAAIRGE